MLETHDLFTTKGIREKKQEGSLILLARGINYILVIVMPDLGALDRYILTSAAIRAG